MVRNFFLSVCCFALLYSCSSVWAGSLVVGVPGEVVAGLHSGALNVIYPDGQNQFLHKAFAGFPGDPNPAGLEGFAWSLVAGDFDGDGSSDLAVGVPMDDDDGAKTDSGAVYVLYGDRKGRLKTTGIQRWNQSVMGVPGEQDVADFFGWSLIAEDFNGDGYDDLAVGTPGDVSPNGVSRPIGAVNIIYGSGGGLQTSRPAAQLFSMESPGIETIQGTAEAIDDWFGYALAAGDINGDGYADLAVGIPRRDFIWGMVPDAGAVTVIYGSKNGLDAVTGILDNQSLYQGCTNAIGTFAANETFGNALSMGDYNGDGFSDLVVGVPRDGESGVGNSGAVQVFYGSAGGLLTVGLGDDLIIYQGYTGIAGTAESGDGFGRSLASGDFDNDGYDDLVVGVPDENVNFVEDGALHVIYGFNGGLAPLVGNEFWHQGTSLPGNNEAGDNFGTAFATGDLNDDGIDDLAIGVPGEVISVGGEKEGAVVFLHGNPNGMVASVKHLYQNGTTLIDERESFDHFGASLAILPKSTAKFPWTMFAPAFSMPKD